MHCRPSWSCRFVTRCIPFHSNHAYKS
uniref:Uncharacterized protein n=1 Tax=Rhizophora mucronata TaxID=61149 RepID=A0A2P2Q9M0_RHIMU